MALNPSLYTQEQFQSIARAGIIKYCSTKLKHEKELNNFKEPKQQELADLIQELVESGVSKQTLDARRVMYEKCVASLDSCTSDDICITNPEKADKILEFVYDNFGVSNSSGLQKSRYMDVEELILEYYVKYYDVKDAILLFKKRQKVILDEIRDDLTGEGVDVRLLHYSYKRLKADVGLLEQGFSPKEVNSFHDYYESIKEVLLPTETLEEQPIVSEPVQMNPEVEPPIATETPSMCTHKLDLGTPLRTP